MIDMVTGGVEITRQEEPRLWNLLENLCISRGITMPKLKVMESEALNAFAAGLNEKQYSVTVTRGLLETLDDAELEAVLGHELTHIRNGDVRLLVIAVVIAGVISFFGELVFRMFFQSGIGWGPRRGGGGSARQGPVPGPLDGAPPKFYAGEPEGEGARAGGGPGGGPRGEPPKKFPPGEGGGGHPAEGAKPFLPERPPVELGGTQPPQNPWGPRR